LRSYVRSGFSVSKEGRTATETEKLDPGKYLQIAGTLLPKEVHLALTQKLPGVLSLADWELVLQVMDAIKQALPDAGDRKPGDVLNYVLSALNAYAPPIDAKLIESPKRI
jgi:hypothetical protein